MNTSKCERRIFWEFENTYMSRTMVLTWLWLLLHVLLLFCSSFWYGCRLWLKCVRLPTLLVVVVIVVCAAIVSFGCWLGLFLPEPGDIFSASESNELSILSVSFLWWIIGTFSLVREYWQKNCYFSDVSWGKYQFFFCVSSRFVAISHNNFSNYIRVRLYFPIIIMFISPSIFDGNSKQHMQ